MTVAIEKTVRELALENPASTRIFEKLGIDYCCGGKRSLREACQSANLQLDQVLDSLEKANQETRSTQKARDWQAEAAASLIEHIQSTHHKYTRREITRLGPLFEKVCSVHGKNHPELFELHEIFQALAQELNAHLMKEEMILFPYILRMEAAAAADGEVARAPFGSVQNPVSMMEHEHDSAGNALRAMNKATNGYSAPADACVSYQTLYSALAVFEADLHQHIHLENNILFPRAVAMEKEILAASHRPFDTTS
jgi:regulator of cell morphogenesis and NO signaling